LNPAGMFLVAGELWQAISEEETIGVGEEVEIYRVNGLILTVGKKNKGG
jgi:membrane-bound ClpP family serine protease